MEKISDQWWKAEYNGKIGLIPSAYVKIEKKIISPPPQTITQNQNSTQKTAIALYDYKADREGVLSFARGNVLTIISQENAEWAKASLNGRTGFVPLKYCQFLDNSPINNSVYNSRHSVSSVDFQHQTPTNSTITRQTVGFQQNQSSKSMEYAQPNHNSRHSIGVFNTQATQKKVIALYDLAQNKQDCLSFKKGEIFNLIDSSSQWWKVESNGRIGLVPSNYMKELDSGQQPITQSIPQPITQQPIPQSIPQPITQQPIPQSIPQPITQPLKVPQPTPQTTETKYKSKFDYVSNREDVLSLKIGEVLVLIEKVNENWLKVTSESTNKQGLVPSNYLEAMETEPIQKRYLAIYDYESKRDDILSFRKGQVLIFVEKANEEWFKMSLDNKIGLVPSQYLKETSGGQMIKQPKKIAPPPSLLTSNNSKDEELLRLREEIRRKEEEEKQKRFDELERQRKQEAERIQLMKEEMKRKEEEEKQRRENEIRKQIEEENRKKRAEQERIQRQNEERRKWEEEQKRKKDEERRRIEEEMQQRKKEHEEKQRALELMKKKKEEERLAEMERRRKEELERQENELKEREERSKRAQEELEKKKFFFKIFFINFFF